MGKVSDVTKDDAFALLRIFLARLPSERAIAEAVSRSIAENIGWVITSKEFRENVLLLMIDGSSTIHDDKDLPILDQDRRWLISSMNLSPNSISTVKKAGSWHELLTAVVLDDSAQALVSSMFANSQRASQFKADVDALKQRNGNKTQTKPKDTSESKPAPKTDTVTKKKSVLTEVFKDRKSGSAEDFSAANAILALRPGQIKGRLNEFFKKSEHIDILRVRDAALVGDYDSDVMDYISYMCARVYLRMFMSRSAYEITSVLLPRMDSIRLFSDSERARLLKTHAMASIRTGQAAKGLDIYRSLISLYPTDFESNFLLGDFSIGVQPDFAEQCLRACLECGKELSPSQLTTIIEFLDQRGDRAFLVRTLGPLLSKEKVYPDYYTCLANAALRTGARGAWRKHMVSHFQAQGLSGADLLVESTEGLFGFGEADHPTTKDHPLVSIVMTSFNASATIREAMKSVLRQTCSNIELIVVDDCSSDQSQSVIAEMEKADSRVRFASAKSNGGTYCAKNIGIEISRGEYVTFHDSDDWMHPQRVERHLAYAQDGVAASVSSWIRMTSDGEAILRKGGGFIHRNPASTFISKEAIQRVGYFDSVRTGADTEMLWRLKDTFGSKSVKEVDDVLALGLHHDNSLTTSGLTAFDEFRYSPVRLEYWENWVAWHFSSLRKGEKMFLPRVQPKRQFDAPTDITVSLES